MSFDKLEFIEAREHIYHETWSLDIYNGEYYKITNGDHIIELIWDDIRHMWFYVDIKECYIDMNLRLVSRLRQELIDNAKLNKKTQKTAEYTNMNLVRSLLHPDIVPVIVNLIDKLRTIHYLETR